MKKKDKRSTAKTVAVSEPTTREIYIPILVYTVALVLLASTDSFLYFPWNKNDSAWFFTCGKALMNGMIPYVEFSDSKGPLLWLTYGIGYLISPRSTWGTCIPTIISYFATFTFCYKTARLFVGHKPALFCVAMMGMFYFSLFHWEVRAEDFCQPFVMFTIYASLRYLRGEGSKKTAIGLGISIAGTFLIKFSVTAMIGATILLTVIVMLCRAQWREIFTMVKWSIISALLFCTPFFLYFIVRGCLDDFWNEYIVNTLITVKPEREVSAWTNYVDSIRDIWEKRTVVVIEFGIILATIIPFCIKYIRLCLIPLIGAIATTAIALMHFHLYYLSPLTNWLIFLPIFIFSLIKISARMPLWLIGIAAVPMVYVSVQTTFFTAGDYKWSDLARIDKNWQEVSECILREAPHPKPTFVINGADMGYGLLSEALPGCKYYATQLGESDEMEKIKLQEIIDKKPDFIIIMNNREGNVRKIIDLSVYEICFVDKITKIYKHR